MNAHHPLAKKERIPIVDALRGLALFGIVLANVPVYPASISTNFLLINSHPVNEVINAVLHVLISTKFLTLFSILFGFGFYIQLKRARQQGLYFRKYFIWRMALLLLIGCLHAYLLWNGDIIRYYAVCGMLLLVFCRLSPEKLLWCAIIFIVPLTGITYILHALLSQQVHRYDNNLASKIFELSTYTAYLRYNAVMDPMVNFMQDSLLTFISCFGKILLGFWLGQIGFFSNPMRSASMLTSWTWWGLTLGVGSSLGYWAISTGKLEMDLPLIWLPFILAAGLVLQSLLYLAAFVKAYHSTLGKRFLMLFVPMGRMALTNYLLQTVFYLCFFYEWSAVVNVGSKLSLADTYLFAFISFCLQVLISHWWLRYFSQGPIEWIWKKLAYSMLHPEVAVTSPVQHELWK